MSLINVYSQSYGSIGNFIQAIQAGQAPEKFTQQHLKDLGFTSSNHRSYIALLKNLGFLTEDGTPTPEYQKLRDQTQAPKVMGIALKRTYSDLFQLRSEPQEERDTDLFIGKFKSTFNVKDRPAQLMTKTFFSLLSLADISINPASPIPAEIREVKQLETQKRKEKNEDEEQSKEPKINNKINTSLHYNIQVHLPATNDIEVYNAIFKSLKEHLLES